MAPFVRCGLGEGARIRLANLLPAARLDGFFLQKRQSTSSIESSRSLNKNNSPDILAETINETSSMGEVIWGVIVGR
jgi:hypothetical protein